MYFDQGEQREVKVGRMLKRAQGKSKVLSQTNWKERVFVLTPTSLRYFEGTNEKRGKCKGCIELASVKAVEQVKYEAFNRNFCFQVVYDDFYLYVIANDEQERKAWIEAIQDECRDNKFLLSTFHPGAFLSKWTCCDGKEKGTQGCKETFVTLERQNAQNSTSPLYHRSSRPNEPLPPIPVEDAAPQRPESDSKKEVVVAIYDFEGTEPGDLSLEKGEIFTLVDKSGEHWWLALNSKGEQGYIPSNYVRKQGMDSEGWFHPDMSRQMAEDNLRKEGKEGCFVVRNSSREGMYTLSVLHGDQVRHYHIKKDQKQQFYISDRHRFSDVLELVNYHQHNSGGLVTRLRNPPTFGNAPVTAGFGHDKWELNRAEITLGRELGAGQFGSVYEGTWRHSIPVAVKMIKDGAMSEDDFIQEAKVMKQFQHAHLVQLYGVCSEKPIYIITELMSQGCLLHFLRKNQSRLSSMEMTEMVRQVATAMKYLELHNFIHRDLAARNCLIDANNVVKVGDFGLARFVVDDEYTASEGTKFPIKWASPEVILYSKFSSKSDIWAFGILIWEIYSSGKQPYTAFNNTEVVQKILNGYRLDKPTKCPEEVYNQIMRPCWIETAEQRPSFEQVDTKIQEFMGEEYDETTE